MSDYYGMDHADLGATVKFSRNSFTLPPGSSTILLLAFTPPASADSSRLPIYSGQISIIGGPVPVKVTYMGVAAKMRDTKMISTRRTQFNTASPALLQGVYANAAGEGKVFKFTATSNTRDFPSILFNLLTGSRSMVMDLVASDANLGFQPSYTKRDLEEAVDEETNEEINLDEDLSESVILINGEQVVQSESDLDFTQGLEAHRRRSHRSLRATRATSATTEKLNAALKQWCELTKYQGKGCTASPAAKVNTFAKVPVKGNIFSWINVSRK